MNFLKELRIKLLGKGFRVMQDNLQDVSIKCSSICYNNPDNLEQGFFCYHAMKYDVSYPVLFFGMRFNVKKNRHDHLIFERIKN